MILFLCGSYIRTQAKFPNCITQERRIFQNENFELLSASLLRLSVHTHTRSIYLSPCQVTSGVIPQAVGQVEGDLSRFKGGGGGGGGEGAEEGVTCPDIYPCWNHTAPSRVG